MWLAEPRPVELAHLKVDPDLCHYFEHECRLGQVEYERYSPPWLLRMNVHFNLKCSRCFECRVACFFVL